MYYKLLSATTPNIWRCNLNTFLLKSRLHPFSWCWCILKLTSNPMDTFLPLTSVRQGQSRQRVSRKILHNLIKGTRNKRLSAGRVNFTTIKTLPLTIVSGVSHIILSRFEKDSKHPTKITQVAIGESRPQLEMPIETIFCSYSLQWATFWQTDMNLQTLKFIRYRSTNQDARNIRSAPS